MSTVLFSNRALAAFRKFSDVVNSPGGIIKGRGATDQAPSLHDDDNQRYDPAKVNELLQFLGDKLDEDDMGVVMDRLDGTFPGCLGRCDGAEDDDDEDERDRSNLSDADFPPANAGGRRAPDAQDTPIPFGGMPKTGGGMVRLAGDARYFRDFPGAKRIGGMAYDQKMRTDTTGIVADDDYYERFPGSKRIGFL